LSNNKRYVNNDIYTISSYFSNSIIFGGGHYFNEVNKKRVEGLGIAMSARVITAACSFVTA
jgi:hypothetical protein